MLGYAIRRCLVVVPTVVAALTFLFLLLFLLPGDVATLVAGGAGRTVDPLVVEQVEERYHLDDPAPVQVARYWQRTVQGDLGTSFQSGRSVTTILRDRGVNSLRLGFWAIVVEAVVGVGLGVVTAIRHRSVLDRATAIATAALAAIPVFVLGFVLQYAFAVYPNKHGWPAWARLRTSGIGPDEWWLGVVPASVEQLRHLALPAVALASVSTALAVRMTRGSMLEVLRTDYVRTARAKGLPERRVVVHHALRNALLPVITLLGLDLGSVIGVAVLTETVFSWPGLGSEIAAAVDARDLPVVLGLSMAVVLTYAMISLAVDLVSAWLDPRLRIGAGRAA